MHAGKSLVALREEDGRQLWSIAEIDLAGADTMSKLSIADSDKAPRANAKQLLEIPGLPILLINRTRLPGDQEGHLLAVNICTGEVLWKKPELDDFLGMVPLYDSDRVMLLTQRTRKGLATALVASEATSSYFLGLGGLFFYNWTGPYPFRPVILRLNPFTGGTDWKQEYSHTFQPGFLELRQLEGQLYLHQVSKSGGYFLGAINLQTGERLWEFKGGGGPSEPPPLFTVGGHLVLTGKNLFALDPGSGKPVWTTSHLGHITGLVAQDGSLFGSSGKSVFAIDSATGTVRWKVTAKSTLTNPVSLPQDKALIVLNKSNFLVIDTLSGKILRQTKNRTEETPLGLQRVGKEFVLAGRELASSLFNTSGEWLTDDPLIEARLPAFGFLVSQPLPPFGSPNAHQELREQLKTSWTKLTASVSLSLPRQLLDNLHPYLDQETWASGIYISKGDQSGTWRFWRIEPGTGSEQHLNIKGSKPDASPPSGLVYLVQNDALRAYKMPEN